MKCDLFENQEVNNIIQELLDESLGVVSNDNGMQALFDIDNNKVLTPFKYYSIDDLLDEGNLVLVRNEEGAFGIIDRKGKELVECEYQDVYDFHNDRAIVYDYSPKYGIIDTEGNIIYPCLCDYISTYNDDGICYAYDECETFAILDMDGNVLTTSKSPEEITFYMIAYKMLKKKLKK